MHRLTHLVRRLDQYTLWAFNPQRPLSYHDRG